MPEAVISLLKAFRIDGDPGMETAIKPEHDN
jgi:hypothetical protein